MIKISASKKGFLREMHEILPYIDLPLYFDSYPIYSI